MDVEEMVDIFLHIISHDVKNIIMRRQFARSGETINRKFNVVLNAILCLHELLLKKLEPVLSDSTYSRWKWFKNCLGTLDGTYIKVNVLASDTPRYQTRNNEIATNVLGWSHKIWTWPIACIVEAAWPHLARGRDLQAVSQRGTSPLPWDLHRGGSRTEASNP
ncbi:hypothetical protein Ddye_006767 [Dipteronia dyeriana]|uniref:DUF8040 domain-containing protein n=1 Tax=Dipteronia dyeriana TaxID=168575 RepID=A0AAE0CR06_9ROSI|nr:hypothetical protein Ddye_006767 [Dipteronia dyeriana]